MQKLLNRVLVFIKLEQIRRQSGSIEHGCFFVMYILLTGKQRCVIVDKETNNNLLRGDEHVKS